MSELLEIIISAIDEASSVFESISQSATDSGTSLQTAFEEATMEVERLEQELADIELGNIEGDFDAVSAQLQQAQAEADALEQEFLEADQAAQSMGDDLGIINSSMLMQIGEQVGNLGSQAEGMAQDMNTAAISVGQLATQTGIAEPQMVSLINTISNATFPNDEAMMYVKSLDQIGVSSGNLGKSATDLDRINDAFGLGADRTNRLGQELSVLGVDMNDVSSSFNALAYANANTVGGMNNYFTFLQKYDAQFKELGLNVDQASVIIAAATQKFGGGKAALSGLNEALKESNGDTRALEEALGLEAGSLENATALTGQYEGQLQTLANEEAEHKTILDQIGAAWEDISLSLGNVASPLMGVVGLFGQMGSFGLQVKGIKELLTTFKGLKTAVMEYSVVQGLASAATSAYGVIVGVVTGEIGLAEAATMAWNAVLAINPIFLVVMALAALAVAIYEVGIAFGWWTDVSSMLDVIWAGLMNIYNTIMSNAAVQAALQALGNAFNFVAGVVNRVIGAFNQFRAGQMDLPTFIMSILTTLVNAYTTIFTTIISFVISVGARLVATIRSAASRMVSGMISYLRQLPGRVYTALIGVVSRIVSAGASWLSNAKSQALSVVNGVYNTFTGLPGKISSALSGVVDAITSPFKSAYDTVVGIVDNIKSKVEEGMDAIGNLGGAQAGEEANGRASLLDNAYAGEISNGRVSLIDNYSTTDNSPLEVDHNLNIVLDLKNVPATMDTDTLIKSLTDRKVLSALTGNSDFQLFDGKAKERLNLKIGRSRGV